LGFFAGIFMKIEINTTDKSVTINECNNLGELFDFLQQSLPEWRDFKISTFVTYTYYPPVYWMDEWNKDVIRRSDFYKAKDGVFCAPNEYNNANTAEHGTANM
jgi:hypothetical protein